MKNMTELETIILRSRAKTDQTKDNYLRAVRAFEAFAGKRTRNGQLVENWCDHMAKTMSAASVNTHLSALRFASRRLAVLRSDPRADFAHGTEWMPEGKKANPSRVLTTTECRELLVLESASLLDLRDHAALQVGLHTGVRRAGLVGWSTDKLRGRDATFLMKGRKVEVTTPLGDKVLEAVRAWRQAAGIKNGQILRGIIPATLDRGEGITESLTSDGLYKALKRRAERLGIEGFHPHAMRHAFISHARAAGVPDWRINAVTGHKGEKGMIDHYTHDTSLVPVGDLLPY